MRVIKLTDSKLNNIIKKVLREQEENQVMSTGPSPEEVTGAPEPEENGELNFDTFMDAARKLLNQGHTVGELVDKILEAQGNEEEPEVEPIEPEMDQGIPSDNQ
jgi:hypothetical protein